MTQPIHYREATSDDVPAMAQCRLTDPERGPADPRMAAYLDGVHHPQEALAPRVAYVAMVSRSVVGYIAGHRTRRYGCDGEVQYLFVSPAYRRQGVASALLHMLAEWLRREGIAKVCVDVDIGSPGAEEFYVSHGAKALNTYWYVWADIGTMLEARVPRADAPT